LNDLVSLPWEVHTEQVSENEWRLTVVGLDDFEVSAETEEELLEHFPGMLRSHLNAYLALQKEVPTPIRQKADVSTSYSAGASGTALYNWNFLGHAIGQVAA